MSSGELNQEIRPVINQGVDATADMVSMTTYNSSGSDVVNFAFMTPKVFHFFNEQGQLSGAKVNMVQSGSVTMSKHSVQEFHRALTVLIETEGWKYD